jgi:hypothetical protein
MNMYECMEVTMTMMNAMEGPAAMVSAILLLYVCMHTYMYEEFYSYDVRSSECPAAL